MYPISIDKSLVNCCKILMNVLECKCDDKEKVIYSVNYLTNLYNHIKTNNIVTNKLNCNRQLALFITLSDEVSIGKYAFCFNQELRNAINNKNITLLTNLFLGPKEMFIEIYNNEYLLYSDKRILITNLAKCMTKNIMCVLNCGYDRENREKYCSCNDSDILDKYEGVNLEKYIYVPDITENNLVYINIFDTVSLVESLSNNCSINPKTKKPFTKSVSDCLTTKLRKEISMYKKYKSYFCV